MRKNRRRSDQTENAGDRKHRKAPGASRLSMAALVGFEPMTALSPSPEILHDLDPKA
jgi:hypothetical protein